MRTLIILIVSLASQHSLAQEKGIKTLLDTIFESGDIIRLSEISHQLSGGCYVVEGSWDTLDSVVVFLETNLELSVTVASHTDQRGSAQANKKLSELRATRIVEYLVKKGISESRLKGYGAGESTLISTDEMISKVESREVKEKLYELNRRTELIVQ